MDKHLLKKLTNYVHAAVKVNREITKITNELYPEITMEEAYEVQEALIQEKLATGHSILGPKMGLTSDEKMKQMNVKYGGIGDVSFFVKA